MTKPNKQPLQAVRRGMKALSPATKKTTRHVEIKDNGATVPKQQNSRKSGSSNQNAKPLIRDEVIGRISPEKIRQQQHQQKQMQQKLEKQQQQQRQDNHYPSRHTSRSRDDEERDANVTSRGLSGRSGSNSRREPASPGRRRGWDTKLEMPRGTVMEHLAEFSLEPPPPPPPVSPRKSGKGKTTSNKGPTGKKGAPRKKDQRRQQSSSPSRRQNLQNQFEQQKGRKHQTPPRSPQRRVQHPGILPSMSTGSNNSTMSRSQLIENPQFASSSSGENSPTHYRSAGAPPPPPPPPPPISPSTRNSSPWANVRRATSSSPRNRQEFLNVTATSSSLAIEEEGQEQEGIWRVAATPKAKLVARDDEWGANLMSNTQSMDSFTAVDEWEADFDETDMWKKLDAVETKVKTKYRKNSPRSRSAGRRSGAGAGAGAAQRVLGRSETAESYLSDDSRDQDVLYSRDEKYSGSLTAVSGMTNLQQQQAVPPPPPLPSPERGPREDREKKKRGKGFLNFFGGGLAAEDEKKKSRSGKGNAHAELLEIGSDATLTAGDLILDELDSYEASNAEENETSNLLAADNRASSNFHAPSFTPTGHRLQNQEVSFMDRPKKKDQNLTGDYLHNKLMELESSKNGLSHKREGDDHTAISNLTDPFMLDHSRPLHQPRGRETRTITVAEGPRNSFDQTRSRSRSRSGAAEQAPTISWEESAPGYGHSALGRALDVQFTPTTVESPQHRPPLLPKSTIASAASGVSGQQITPAASMSSRLKMRSRSPSPMSMRKAAHLAMKRSSSRTPSPGSRRSSAERRNQATAEAAYSGGGSPRSRKSHDDDWSRQKDDMIEQRVAESKSKAGAKKLMAQKYSIGGQQKRSASATPAQSKSGQIAQKPSKLMERVRSQSASRAQPPVAKPVNRRASPSQKGAKRLDRVGGPAVSQPTKPAKMEPLSSVMSRVPSSLGSRADSIELRRQESEASFLRRSASASRAKSTSEQKRQASPHGTKSSPARVRQDHAHRPNIPVKPKAPTPRPASTGRAKVTPERAEMPRPKKATPTQAKVAPAPQRFPDKEKTFPMQLSTLKAKLTRGQKKSQESPHNAPNHKYVPTNAYAGRFTPKKSKRDKLTEIIATKELERETRISAAASNRSSANGGSSSPSRKQVPRHVGAQKLRNMIKLRNHFTSESESMKKSPERPTDSTSSLLSVGVSIQSPSPHYVSDETVIPPFRSTRVRPKEERATDDRSTHDRMSMIRDHGLIDSFSVGSSNMRSLRSAIQGSNRSDRIYWPTDDLDLSYYDETRIDDPMQRAGLRLLSSAVIPIQAAARRYLARCEALSLLWGALVIQARVRAFLEQRRYEYKVFAIMTIQSAVRGMLARDRLMFEDYCATEIQRHVRGHLAAVRVYDDIYKISLVQSQIRMKLAIRAATLRMYCILKLQGVSRGFLVRCRLKDANKSARDIQRCVRGYLASMRVYEELYKITLVQNRIRRKQALDKATVKMALVLSLQALARGYLVRCRLDLAHYHATTIQRYARGYLGTMHVYEELYKVMLIQNFFRMRIALNLATKRMTLIIKVQASWRRYCVLRRMEYAHDNAMVIQRYVRGYLSTMGVYEEIYKITLIQNFVRMKQAKRIANTKRNMVIHVQAIVRGFILRGRLEKIRDKAITIQSAWRRFYYRLVYQFKLLDIIILQSVWRRKRACRIANQKRLIVQTRAATVIQTRWRCYDAQETYLQYQIENRAATIIQTQWRCYDTSMDYLHFLADVLIVQSMVRRWFAMREVTGILIKKSIVLQRVARGYLGRVEVRKHRAAVKIQTTWRGFVAFADYMFKIADVVIVQTVARRWIACRKANYLRHKIEHDAARVLQRWRRRRLYKRERAATTIQKVWRGLVQEADYTLTVYEYRAARSIQTYWRRFWKFSNYLICLDCSIRIQAVVRGFLARCRYADEQWGAVILQAAARGIVGKRRATSRKMLRAQTLTSNAIGSLQSMAATLIQAQLRGYIDRVLCKKHEASRIIQTIWRKCAAEIWYAKTLSVIQIQKNGRRMIYAAAYHRFLSARCIQSRWRMNHARQVVLCRKTQTVAATTIQSAWRGYFFYTNYLFSLCDIVKVQGIIRRHLARKRMLERSDQKANFAAQTIQKSWRGFYAYTCFLITLSEIIRIQSFARRFLVRSRRLNRNATVVQKAWRRTYYKSKYALDKTKIVKAQSQLRCFLARNEAKRRVRSKLDKAAALVQKTWRKYFCLSNYRFIVADIIKVQSVARRYLAQKVFFDKWEDHAINSAIAIQSRWRSYFASTNYKFVRDDAIKIQAAARGLLARNTFLEMFGEKCRQSASLLQRTWRKHQDQKAYRSILFKVCLIQQRVRYFLAMKELEEEAAIPIQRIWRGIMGRAYYRREHSNIVIVQSCFRRQMAKKQFRQLCIGQEHKAATKIQAAIRGKISSKDFAVKRSAILDIQRYWRGFTGRIGLFVAWKKHIVRIHSSALQIQKTWRGYAVQQHYLYALGSVIEIQSLARMIVAKAHARRKHASATKIQSLRRKYLARRVMLDIFSKLCYAKSNRHSAALTQTVCKIQGAWRNVLRKRLENRSAVIIQWFGRVAIARTQMEHKIAAKKISTFLLKRRSSRLSPEDLLAQQQNESATKLQTWYLAAKRLRERRRHRAGIVILRFFQMVKAEVDREIEQELQRRKQRKEVKKRHHQKDDQILERAWEKTSKVGLDRYSKRKGPTTSDKIIEDTLNEIQSRSRCNKYTGNSPRQTGGAPPMLALADALEDQSCAQSTYHSVGEASFLRKSPSRVESFSQKDFDEDYCLEEAFLDAEIYSAKSRRKSDKRKSPRHKHKNSKHNSSSNASVASRASQSSRMSASSRVSGSSRMSSGTRESRDARESSGVAAGAGAGAGAASPRQANSSRKVYKRAVM